MLIGAFAGAPLLARELETGTYRYAWTQGLGRERQAIAKLALVGVTLAVLAGAFGELFAWFFQPFLYEEQMNVLTETVFDTRGLVFPAFTLVAFAIGAFFGMLLRRIIPAMAATLGVYLAVRLAAWGVRKYYPVAVVTSNTKIFSQFQTPSLPGYPWILSTWVTGPGGKPASPSVANQILTRPGQPAPDGVAVADARRPGVHRVDQMDPAQPLLADAVHRGRLAARPRGRAHRRDRLAGPPPGGLDRADGDNSDDRSSPSPHQADPGPRPGRSRPDRGRCRGRECCGSPGGSTAAC